MTAELKPKCGIASLSRMVIIMIAAMTSSCCGETRIHHHHHCRTCRIKWSLVGGPESQLSGCFRLFALIFWEVVGAYKCYFVILWLQVEWWGEDTQRWLGHSNPTMHFQVVGTVKYLACACSHSFKALTPIHVPHALAPDETSTT